MGGPKPTLPGRETRHRHEETPAALTAYGGFGMGSLALTYFHMGANEDRLSSGQTQPT